MGKIVPLNLVLESSPGRYGPDGAGQIVNCLPELAGDPAKVKFPLYPIEGLVSIATLTGGGRTRGAIDLGSYGYVVSGPLLFKVEAGGTNTIIGGFPGSDPVFMATNRKSPHADILLISQGQRYICTNDILTPIADTDLPNANSVTFLDGYFVATVPDGRFFISALDDGTSWDSLDFHTAEGQSDGLLCGYARSRELLLFGTKSIEYWANTGNASFPFEQIPGTFQRNLGLLSQNSVRDLTDIVFFVASDGTVRRLNGYTPEPVSTPAVERDIDRVDPSTITATAYSLKGHQFYNISCPEWTWTFDAQYGAWHQRQSYQQARWRGEVFVDINGTKVVGDHTSPVLYRIDPDVYTEAGEHLVWTTRFSPMHTFPSPVGVDRIFLDTIPGTGLNAANAHNSNPQLMMRYSDDGGKTWSIQRTAPTGQIGEFSKRVKFEQLGQSREDGRIFEVSMSAAVVRGLTGAAADVEPLEG